MGQNPSEQWGQEVRKARMGQNMFDLVGHCKDFKLNETKN